MKTIAIIPAYNEEKTIGEVIKRFKELDISSLVIDDGSTDSTLDIAYKSSAMVLYHNINMGKGESLKTAFQFLKSSYPSHFKKIKYIIIIDADLQYDPYESPKLIEILEKDKADYVIGNRNWKQVPLRHRLGNWVWIKTFNFLFRTKLKDTNCGFVAMKIEVMKKLNVSSGYIVDNDMIIQVLGMGCRVKNIPVSVNYSDKRNFFSGLRMVIGILIFITIKSFKEERGIYMGGKSKKRKRKF